MSRIKIIPLGLVLIALTSISSGCGMPVETRTYAPYQKIPREACWNREVVKSQGEVTQLINNTLFVYAASNRVHGQRQGFYKSDAHNGETLILDLVDGRRTALARGSTKGIFVGAGNRLSVWIYYKTDSLDAVHLYLSMGNTETKVADIDNLNYGWVNIILDTSTFSSAGYNNIDDWFYLYAEADGANNKIHIETISANELSNPATEAWTDTTVSNCKLGEPDYPLSAACCDLIRRNSEACYGFRTTKANLYNDNYLESGGDIPSGGTNQTIARFVARKSEGVTSVDFVSTLQTYIDSGVARYTVSLYKTVTNPFDTLESSHTIDITTTGATVTDWYSHTFTSLTSSEIEYELRVEVKIQSGTPSVKLYVISNVFLADALDGSDISHVLPNKKHTEPDDDILEFEFDNLKATLEQVWNRKRQILVDHFRNGERRKGRHVGYTIIGGLLYPSYGSRYLKCKLIGHVDEGGKGTLAYDNEVSGFSGGGIHDIVGGTSGATAIIGDVIDNGTDGYLYLYNVNGIFLNNEQITVPSTGISADVDGFLQDGFQDTKVHIVLGLYHRGDYIRGDYFNTGSYTVYLEQLLDITDTSPRGALFAAEISVPIPEEYWNDNSETNNSPLEWDIFSVHLKTDGTNASTDYFRVKDAFVYEVQETELLTKVP